MRTNEGRPVRLEDYRPTPYAIETVHLTLRLSPRDTEVVACIAFAPRPETAAGEPLVLAGDELTLVAADCDGAPLDPSAYAASADAFELKAPPARPFTQTLATRISPETNRQLMGLFLSSGTYCTQCEAEGFRRITYFYDRPDVLAVYTTRIEADREAAPVLLANGNLVDSGPLKGDPSRHVAVWHDPFPKPSYLFAMVAGDLGLLQDSFTTMSGREVDLRIYVEKGNEPRAAYAMDALKRSMRWDERAYGREYDLDIFMIVAVSDFNMGAMENKGLNIFNDKYVLAEPTIATDADYAAIEAIIAHEYFHNWTGNRITCRDWFQLCLKEGLTVFRDQEFTSDERSRAVKRIADVRLLRAHQFPEDAGPLAHPVRPEVYSEINNFYTATVYEKGAEICRMLKTLLGDDGFRAGMDLYFERHDGEAVTIEEFLAVFTDATGRDLDDFHRWYTQAGTPRVKVEEDWDAAAGRYALTLSQSTPPTPGQEGKAPVVIPMRLGLLDERGGELALPGTPGQNISGDVLTLDEASATLTLEGLAAKPVPSLLRGFSAPVALEHLRDPAETLFLIAHDSDPFNRWQAVQDAFLAWLTERARAGSAASALPGALVDAMAALATDETLDPAFRGLALQVPSETEIAHAIAENVDPDRVRDARASLRAALGSGLSGILEDLYRANEVRGAYSPAAADASRRSLRNTALDLLVAAGATDAAERAVAQFEAAGNMTDRLAALSALVMNRTDRAEAALDRFAEIFAGEPLALDKWFALQAQVPAPETLARVEVLMAHPHFTLDNPNRVRALIGAFATANLSQFHRADGAGYRFVGGIVEALDGKNPQVAARLLTAFRSYRQMEAGRRAEARKVLEAIAGREGLSSDVADIVGRILK